MIGEAKQHEQYLDAVKVENDRLLLTTAGMHDLLRAKHADLDLAACLANLCRWMRSERNFTATEDSIHRTLVRLAKEQAISNVYESPRYDV